MYQYKNIFSKQASILYKYNDRSSQKDKELAQFLIIENFLNDFSIDLFEDIDLEKIKNNFSRLNFKKINKLTDSNLTFNIYIQTYLMIIISEIINNKSNYKNNIIYEYFDNLKIFNTDSIEGYISYPSFSGDNLIIKIPRLDNNNIKFEAFIGLNYLNHLRKFIPNFTFTYGLFTCGKLEYDRDDNKVRNWCDKGYDTNYLIIENIKNNKTFSKIINEINIYDLINILIQIFQALDLAYKEYGYRHNDLHTENVLIKTLDEPIFISYDKEIFTYEANLKCKYIPMIIDYGFNSVSLKTDNNKEICFGLYNDHYINNDVKPSDDFQIFDYYKLICFLGRDLLNHNDNMNEDNFILLDVLFGIFEKGSLKDRVKLYYENNNVHYYDDFFTADKDLSKMNYKYFLKRAYSVFEDYQFNFNDLKNINDEEFSSKFISIDNFINNINNNEEEHDSLLTSCVYRQQVKNVNKIINEINNLYNELEILLILLNKFKKDELIINNEISDNYLEFLNYISSFNGIYRKMKIKFEIISCANNISKEIKNKLLEKIKKIKLPMNIINILKLNHGKENIFSQKGKIFLYRLQKQILSDLDFD